MKPLKPTTITRYTNKQLIKHLDRLLDQFTDAPYRVGLNAVLELHANAYVWFCSDANTDAIIEAINTCYTKLGLR